jgi:hypothetical protein
LGTVLVTLAADGQWSNNIPLTADDTQRDQGLSTGTGTGAGAAPCLICRFIGDLRRGGPQCTLETTYLRPLWDSMSVALSGSSLPSEQFREQWLLAQLTECNDLWQRNLDELGAAVVFSSAARATRALTTALQVCS